MAGSLITKGWDELKELVEAFLKDREQIVYQRIVSGYLGKLSNEQRRVIKASFDTANDQAGLLFYWSKDPDPVLSYLGLFLDEGAIRPIKHSPLERNGYRFAPWFFQFIKENPEILNDQEE